MSTQAKLIGKVIVTDPDTKSGVQLNVFRHENGKMFAISHLHIVHLIMNNNFNIQDPLEDAEGDGCASYVELTGI